MLDIAGLQMLPEEEISEVGLAETICPAVTRLASGCSTEFVPGDEWA
jgi:hypothetical protein